MGDHLIVAPVGPGMPGTTIYTHHTASGNDTGTFHPARYLDWHKPTAAIELSDSLVKDILHYLECPPGAPTLRYLNRLIFNYIRRVPWESVSRIIKRHMTPELEVCPRWPGEFWQDALQFGFGGTCYESSLAFFSLLSKLGYEGYLTVNDMGESLGCHAAIVVLLNGHKYLVDITIPIQAAVRLDPQKTVRRRTSFQSYTIQPLSDNRFDVERSHHPHKYAFTLIDRPVSLPDYQMILQNDYRESGFFLNSVVMVKVIDGKTWRFFSDKKPYRVESSSRAGKSEWFPAPRKLPGVLAKRFQMPEDKIAAALAWASGPTGSMPTNGAGGSG